MPDRSQPLNLSAYGGGSWSPRKQSITEELGSVWAQCGINSECSRLRTVLLHRPGNSLAASENPATQKFLEELGVNCVTVEVDELGKAAGAIGCLTGVLHRESV